MNDETNYLFIQAMTYYEEDMKRTNCNKNNYESIRDFLLSHLLNNSKYIYYLIPAPLFLYFYKLYDEDRLDEFDINDIYAMKGYSCLLNEQQLVDQKTLKFFEKWLSNNDITAHYQFYKEIMMVYGMISCYKNIIEERFWELMETNFPSFSDHKIALILNILMHMEFVELHENEEDDYIIDIFDEDSFELISLIADTEKEDYDYGNEFYYYFGLKQYLKINKEAKAFDDSLKTLISYELDEDTKEAKKHFVDLIVLKAIHYECCEDIMNILFPVTKEELVYIKPIINSFKAFVNTLPCSLYGGVPYGKVVLNKENIPLLLNEYESHFFEQDLYYIATTLIDLDKVKLKNSNNGYHHLIYDPYLYFINHPEAIDEIIDNHAFLSKKRAKRFKEMSNCLIDWCKLLKVDDDYVYIVDCEGNTYRVILEKIELLLNFIEAKYLPLLLINYNGRLVASSLNEGPMKVKKAIKNKLDNQASKVNYDNMNDYL